MLAVGDSVSVPEALLLAFTTSQLAGLIFTYSTPPPLLFSSYDLMFLAVMP